MIAITEKSFANLNLRLNDPSEIVHRSTKYGNPTIEQVHDIGLNNETDIELLRSEIYDAESRGYWNTTSEVINNFFKDEHVKCITKEDCPSYREFRQERERTAGKGNQRNSSEIENGRRGNENAEPLTVATKKLDFNWFHDKLLQYRADFNPSFSRNWRFY